MFLVVGWVCDTESSFIGALDKVLGEGGGGTVLDSCDTPQGVVFEAF